MKLGRNIGSVTIPKRPATVGGLIGWARGVNRALQELRDRKVAFAPQKGRGREQTPFKLSVSTVDNIFYWKVSQFRSSIQDGTNGDAIDLSPSGAAWTGTDPIKFDTNTEIASTKYIVLQASVDEFLVITDWTLAAVDAADAVEVGDDAGTPPKQNKIRLLIGKVIIDTVPEPDTISATQAVFSPQIIVDDMTNGMLCRVFANHGIQIDNL